MNPLKKLFILSGIACMLSVAACTDRKTTTTEETEIKRMDSTSKVIKENTDKLDDQTRKVEESLEQLDKEENK